MTARDGQVSVITGGSAGLGLAIAAALAQAGSTVVLASRSAERCEQAARSVAERTGRPRSASRATSPTRPPWQAWSAA